jgi:hypothetical protein
VDWTPEHDALLREGVSRNLSWADTATWFTNQFHLPMTEEQARSHWRRLQGKGGAPAEPKAVKTEAEKAEESATIRNLRKEVADLIAEAGEFRRLADFYSRARSEPLAPKTWTITPTRGGHVGIVVAQMADWHLDEVVRPEEVFHLNAYNRNIAKIRMKRWVEKVATLPRDYMKGVHLEGLKVLATGDLFTGDIHAELKESNEDRLLSSLLYWMEPMIAALEVLEQEYNGEVEVDAVVGNHGRTTLKPVFKGRARSNVEWLFWSVVRDRLIDRGSKVRVNVSESMDLNVPIYGRNHLVTHGDQFHGGTGIAGAYSPLSLGAHRKGQRQMAAEMPMDLMVMGHFHQFLDLPGTMMGGSMKGYDEYAFGLNLRPEQAKQALWITTPERLKIMTMPVELQNREKEGW